MAQTILIYNNRTGIAERMEPFLAGDGFGVLAAQSVEQMEALLAEEDIQLMLVDVEFGSSGWDEGIRLIAGLREKSRIPLIAVSEQSAEAAVVCALGAGADDYVTADCNPLEVLARIQSQLRRYIQLKSLPYQPGPVYQAGGLVIDDGQKKVTVDGRIARLTNTEYRILKLLVRQRGRVFSNSQIYESIWQTKAIETDNCIAVHVRHIREKIETNPREPRYLKVVWGVGYVVR